MRILFIVQRYGAGVNGGAEQHCRWLAETMAEFGHDAHVATTRARDYTSWEDHYPGGVEVLNGVTIHRFGVDTPRDMAAFNSFSEQIDFVGHSHSLEAELEWLRAQGPASSALDTWLDTNADQFDVAVVFTYLYRTAHYAIHRLRGRVPIAMHATAHDEPPFHLPTIQALLRDVELFLCSTPEESDLLAHTVGASSHRAVVGVGVPDRAGVDRKAELHRLGINEDDRFALVLGRVDGSKGVLQAVKALSAIEGDRHAPPRVVVAGQNVAGLRSDRSTTFLGYVSDDQVTALLQNCTMLVQPSRWESFSLVLCEAWAAAKPVVVNGASNVMGGHVLRSQGGLIYQTDQQLRHAVSRLMSDPWACERLGSAGARYVRSQFDPVTVGRRIERELSALSLHFEAEQKSTRS
jgi:glycosyltransferase involved in cell wall biosynthesis